MLDLLQNAPLPVRMFLAPLISRMTKEEQKQISDDIQGFMYALKFHDSENVVAYLDKYNVVEMYEQKFGSLPDNLNGD